MKDTILPILVVLLLLGFERATAAPDSEQIEFFESRIRPLLAQECYECHSEATKAKGGLLLDTRAGWQKGGDSGESVIVPGDPASSLLLQSVRHEVEDLEMPKAGAKLEKEAITDFEKWIEMGAPDPRDAPPSPGQLSQDTNWEAIRERRKGWWSFQPIQNPDVPRTGKAAHPVDAFVWQRLSQEGLEPSSRAEPRILHRRIAYTLTGLPPTIEESRQFLKQWEADPSTALSQLVDAQIASSSFGEKWARHWMDWIRYADSHGSEGDPAIPHAWQYRDYLIRALNSDISYKQLTVEHLAGDLLTEPRINKDLQINESAIGPAHLRMVFHGFAPTDALDERVRFTDDQVNTVTKAFLGLTVSCARCHDHKFDAISQADFYALYGIFTAPLPATVAIDAPGVLNRNRDRLAELKKGIRTSLSQDWLRQISKNDGEAKWDEKKSEESSILQLIAKMKSAENPEQVWQSAGQAVRAARSAKEEWKKTEEVQHHWDFATAKDSDQWTREGEGLDRDDPSSAGSFTISPDGDVVGQVLPAGIYSHLISTRHRGFLATPSIHLDGEYDLHVRMIGEGASGRYAVQHYPRKGTVYPITNLAEEEWKWTRYTRLDYWNGDRIHLEFATAGEAPIHVSNKDRSWFGVREAWLVKKGSQAPSWGEKESLEVLFGDSFEANVKSVNDAESKIRASLVQIIEKWARSDAEMSDAEALFLNEALDTGILSQTPEGLSDSTRQLVAEYRRLEQEIPTPTRAPGLVEHSRHEQPLYDRGNHKKPLEIVPARFLEAIDQAPYQTDQSGRLELADDLFRDDNPFTARVIVNRVWHHLFGNGLVATMDNFGRLGEEPSHPELLDFLATRFRAEHDWSLKKLIRDLVLTETWLQASAPSENALSLDPQNRLLSHFSMRRLEAESIRDSLLAITGSLDEKRYGPPVNGNTPRRSVYLQVKRNNLDPLLTTFDFPVPATTVGKRSQTNVPAQSLTLLNDQFVIEQARRWSRHLDSVVSREATADEKITAYFEMGLNRIPTTSEIAAAKGFLSQIESEAEKLKLKKGRMSEALNSLRKERRALLDPVRAALQAKLSDTDAPSEPAPEIAPPLEHWDFAEGVKGTIGKLKGSLKGSARIEDGALVLDGSGLFATGAIPISLSEKSLYVRVQLETDQQRGGGVITLQDLQGGVFDSLVFAELSPGKWLAGSNNHRRSDAFDCPVEKEAVSRPVSLVLTYQSDGTIQCFRDGEHWGDPIRKSSLVEYGANQSQIVLGMRHGAIPPGKDAKVEGGNRMFRGRVLEASLFDRALAPGEVKSLSGKITGFVSEEQVIQSLTESQRQDKQRLDEEIEFAENRLETFMKQSGGGSSPLGPWGDLAHAIFNLKEWIYLR